MSIFENLILIDKKGEFLYNKWEEWNHFFVVNKPEWYRVILRSILGLLGHCMECSAPDGCYFVSTKIPKQPLHDRCDCDKINIDFNKVKKTAKAECDIRKFTEYIFKDSKFSKGKNVIFNNMGYDINDSKYLQNEYCKQSLEQYLKGNYILKNLDLRGQRLAIPIILNGKSFYTGWIMCPEGLIKNTTPFGGWVNEKI